MKGSKGIVTARVGKETAPAFIRPSGAAVDLSLQQAREKADSDVQQNEYRTRWALMTKFVLGLLASFVAAPLLAREGEWLVHFDGTSRHFHRRDLNEQNGGAGFTYEFNPTDRYVVAADGDYFRDSLRDPSGYLGASYRRRFRYLDVGVLGFIMYRESAKETIGSRIFPGALPFLEFGTRRIRFRTTYIPRVTGRDDEAVTLQLLVRI